MLAGRSGTITQGSFRVIYKLGRANKLRSRIRDETKIGRGDTESGIRCARMRKTSACCGQLAYKFSSLRRHLNLSNLALDGGKRVILQPLNPNRPVALVKVAPSVTQVELNRELEVLGYAFPFGPLVSDVTIAGAIATSSHSANFNEPSMGGFMTAVRLIDGRGSVRQFSENRTPVVMKALRCNLGLLGIVFEIEMKVVPLETVSVRRVFTPLRNLFKSHFLRHLVTKNYIVNVMYGAYNSLTEEEARWALETGRVPRTWDSANDLVLLQIINPSSKSVNLAIEDKRPESAPNVTVVSLGQTRFNQLLSAPAFVISNLSQATHVPAAVLDKTEFSEYTIQHSTFTEDAKVLKVLSSLLNEKSYKKGIQPLQLGLFRWFAGANCFLCAGSATVGRNRHDKTKDLGHFASFHLHDLVDSRQDIKRARAFQTAVIQEWDKIGNFGRPHWGKVLQVFPNLKQRIKLSYGLDLDIFKTIRESLDAHGVFTNAFLRYLFDIKRKIR
ncbi:uncharacterized protein LOC106159302 [Lingula anatina]|uniref:Uncharacterized protein LOC106159302 n=1 Tax=Lingula anatina TaxID=7574 RepID=A0A1S3HYA3_LINAN|nr:uncharacterized protein LOC106159302 [Lingula anatina]|eukprot:XP_013390988.1 uncharacterized protein LOC106159302 [Lingula anatina]